MKSIGFKIVPSYIQKDLWKSKVSCNAYFDIIKAWVLQT